MGDDTGLFATLQELCAAHDCSLTLVASGAGVALAVPAMGIEVVGPDLPSALRAAAQAWLTTQAVAA